MNIREVKVGAWYDTTVGRGVVLSVTADLVCMRIAYPEFKLKPVLLKPSSINHEVSNPLLPKGGAS